MNFRNLLLACASSLLLSAAADAIPTQLRLFEIPVTRFTIDHEGKRWSQTGRLSSYGGFYVDAAAEVPSTVSLPAAALDRLLIDEDRWTAYTLLGPDSVDNFVVDQPFAIQIGSRFYSPIAISDEARFDIGDLVNLSARAIITPGGEPLIGGFVIENQARRVLIRAVGPSLDLLGVTNPLPDPYLEIYKQGSGTVILFNDDWNQRPDAPEIKQISELIGAFTLLEGSKDAVYMYEFVPGAYTAHLKTYGTTGGSALLEIYVLP